AARRAASSAPPFGPGTADPPAPRARLPTAAVLRARRPRPGRLRPHHGGRRGGARRRRGRCRARGPPARAAPL
ncbi:MAG: hypothetical protein AVDCRST_MAG77-4967, partial [uncultured Chloroflexi bacterium]